MTKPVVLGVLLRVPMIVPPVAEVITGKFCRLFAPVSGSWLSLGVTPTGPRSVPRAPLLKMEFFRIVFWMLVESAIRIPAPLLLEILLPHAATVQLGAQENEKVGVSDWPMLLRLDPFPIDMPFVFGTPVGLSAKLPVASGPR